MARPGLALLGIGAVAAFAAGGGAAVAVDALRSSPSPPAPAPSVAPRLALTGFIAVRGPAPLPQLPRGGRVLFPRYRMVAYYGNAESSGLGVLGETSPELAARRLATRARQFATRSRPVLPAFELIVTVAQRSPGPDGTYRARTPVALVDRYLKAARRARAYLVLDIQPGRAAFLPEVKYWERFLRQPDVGLALDAEWSMRPGQVPGSVIGSTDAATVNGVSAYLDALTRRHRLPQKLFVLHQFRSEMLPDRASIRARPGLATTFHIDGFGGRQVKRDVYRDLRARRPFWNGFKLFLDEDVDLLSPREALGLRPAPDLVSYQ